MEDERDASAHPGQNGEAPTAPHAEGKGAAPAAPRAECKGEAPAPCHPEGNGKASIRRHPEGNGAAPTPRHPERSGAAAEPKDPVRRQPKPPRERNALVFGAVALAWLALDLVTKGFFNSGEVGQVVAGPFAGLIRFRLVHNTGAAWGMFGDSTFLLGVLSLVVCLVLTAYLFFLSPRPSLLEVLGVGLVVAGGLGNALDRFTLGYVVDFIEPVFIDFPVFNVADIGVTCGFVLFVAGLLLAYRREDREIAACMRTGALAQEAGSEAGQADAGSDDSAAPEPAEAKDGEGPRA